MSLKKPRSHKNTLLFHLTLLYALIFILSTSITFLIFYSRVYSLTMAGMDEELIEDAVVFSRLLEEKGLQAVIDAIEDESYSNVDTEEFIRLLDAAGALLASTDTSAWGDVDASPPKAFSDRGFPLSFHTHENLGLGVDARVLTAVIGDGMILQKGEILEEADEYLGIFRRLFFILILVLFFLSILIGWFLAGRALADMEEVTRTAQRISRGQFDRRVRVTGRYAEIQRLGTTFNRMLDQIQALLKSMKEINDNIAHDLRSPIARIRGFAEMALMGNSSDSDYKEVAINTIEECDSLIDMVNTMLDITEAEAGVQEVKREPVDLTSLIGDALELFRPMANEKQISLRSQFPNPLEFTCDRKKMQRVVTNLLENAIKYTPEKGIIEVSGGRRNGGVELVFKDTGMGISEIDLPRVFERFYRCDRSRSQSGVGLGLCLAKAYTEAMDGRISVTSTPEIGSVFKLQFSR